MEKTNQETLDWAEMTYGTVMLSDQRRTRRAVQIASSLAYFPMGSLPNQMGSCAATKAAYRFLESPAVSYERLMRPHLQQSLEALQALPLVLLVQDTTELNYSRHPKTTGLGPIGKGSHGQGILLQSVLAICPNTKAVLGIAAQEPFLREPAPKGEKSAGRQKRVEKESQVWFRQVKRLGVAPPTCRYIHVGDRASDIFSFMQLCTNMNCGFTLRVQHNRRVDLRVDQGECAVPSGARRGRKQMPLGQEAPEHLFEVVRSWPSHDQQTLSLDGNQKRPQRDAHLNISWGSLRLWEPKGTSGLGAHPIVVRVVRTWEPDPPEGCEALEWLLLVSEEISTLEQAWEKVHWYRMRWTIEEYHQCLKTGCHIEDRQMQTYEGLRTFLGLIAPLAIHLLHLRTEARLDPEGAASEVISSEVVRLVAYRNTIPVDQMTVRQCWHAIAKEGGFLGRKGDGEPGWKTLWKGWLYLQTLLEGVHLAAALLIE
jgi:hypothetical protein